MYCFFLIERANLPVIRVIMVNILDGEKGLVAGDKRKEAHREDRDPKFGVALKDSVSRSQIQVFQTN